MSRRVSLNSCHDTVKAMRLPRLFKRSQNGPGPGPGILPPARADIGPEITPRAALQHSAVYRAVSVIQTAARQLTLDAWNATGPVPSEELKALIRRPDPAMTQSAFTVETVAALALTGNAYWQVTRAKDARPIGLRFIDPALCVPVLDTATGKRATQYAGKTWAPYDLIHLRKTVVPGLAPGLGPIQAAARELGAAIEMSRYTQQFTGPGKVPFVVLSAKGPLTQEQADEARTRWDARRGNAVVFGEGMDVKTLQFSPADLQFIESRAFDTLAIARLFGIPSRLMMAAPDGSAMTYANLQDEDISFMRWTVTDYLRPIEDALTDLLPRGWQVRYNMDAVLRPATKTRYETHKIGIDAGLLTVEEARRIEGLTQ